MTIDELHALSTPFITPAEAASVLHCDPQLLRVQARNSPLALGFPVVCIGSRVRIPRIAFLQYLGYKPAR